MLRLLLFTVFFSASNRDGVHLQQFVPTAKRSLEPGRKLTIDTSTRKISRAICLCGTTDFIGWPDNELRPVGNPRSNPACETNLSIKLPQNRFPRQLVDAEM
jgi:hypothetical protein